MAKLAILLPPQPGADRVVERRRFGFRLGLGGNSAGRHSAQRNLSRGTGGIGPSNFDFKNVAEAASAASRRIALERNDWIMSPLDLTIVIVNWNTRELLSNCLRSIRQAAPSLSYKTVVIDNKSRDGSLEMVQKDFPECIA